MNSPGLILLQAQIEAKRGEERLLSALGTAIDHEKAFRPEVASALKTAWLSARDAGATLRRIIEDIDRKEDNDNVISFDRARMRRGVGK